MADNVAVAGVNAPPAFWVNEEYPEMSIVGPENPVAPGSANKN